MPSLQFAVLYLLIAGIVYGYVRMQRLIKRPPLPPGPTRLPFIGNVNGTPHHYAWLTYAHWSKTFGDVIYTEFFGSQTIILNSLKAATELLEKRSSNYSDRPDMIMANELMEWGWDFAHMRHSEIWRKHRKTFHQYFQPRAASGFESVQRQATNTLLRQLLDSPDKFAAHVRQHAGSIILRLVYGYKVHSENDDYVALANEAIQGLGQAVHAGAFYVDYLPIMKYIPAWFPGAKFQRQAKIWAKSSHRLRDTPFEITKSSIASGTAASCFVTKNLEHMKNANIYDPQQEEIIKNCAGIAYLGMTGSDTTVSVVLTWMLAMAHYPDVQTRARAEIDSITGGKRLPGFEDRDLLPYVEACLLETLRWNPVAPLAVPHRSVREDVYNGYYIPAGATVIGNTWAILHDENIYPEPFKFKPDRFLNAEGCPDPIVSGAFGFGRRICPGRYLALSSAWIAIASILSTFIIVKPLDLNGEEVNPPIEYTDGLVIHPKPFSVRLIPRSPEAATLVRNL